MIIELVSIVSHKVFNERSFPIEIGELELPGSYSLGDTPTPCSYRMNIFLLRSLSKSLAECDWRYIFMNFYRCPYMIII